MWSRVGGDAGGTRARRVTLRYDSQAVEARWRRRWEVEQTYRTPAPSSDAKQYVLDFFPYPSGEGLSVGHARNYVPTDVLARYFRMRGFVYVRSDAEFRAWLAERSSGAAQ